MIDVSLYRVGYLDYITVSITGRSNASPYFWAAILHLKPMPRLYEGYILVVISGIFLLFGSYAVLFGAFFPSTGVWVLVHFVPKYFSIHIPF